MPFPQLTRLTVGLQQVTSPEIQLTHHYNEANNYAFLTRGWTIKGDKICNVARTVWQPLVTPPGYGGEEV